VSSQPPRSTGLAGPVSRATSGNPPTTARGCTPIGHQGVGVALQGDLRVGPHPEGAPHLFEDARDPLGWQTAGGAAAETHGANLHRRQGQARPVPPDLAHQRVQVRWLQAGVAHLVEGAVRVNFQRSCGSTHFVWSPSASCDIWGDSFDRAHDPAGFARQLGAVLASGSRSGLLHRIRCPTLVLHGLADPLFHPDAARKMARLIPSARLRLVEGLGHDLPMGVWPILVDEVVSNARRAD